MLYPGTLLLDSADVAEARAAAALGLVKGATTNPTLLARVGRPAERVIPELADILGGFIFYQVRAATVAEREAEARRMLALRPHHVGIKIPCSAENLALARRLADEGFPIGVTAVFHPAQVFLAARAGAAAVLPYVNRMTRLMGDGPGILREMRAVVEAVETPMQVIAASVKDPDEAVAALVAGAQGLTLPLAVIQAMADHPLSAAAIEAFDRAS